MNITQIILACGLCFVAGIVCAAVINGIFTRKEERKQNDRLYDQLMDAKVRIAEERGYREVAQKEAQMLRERYENED